MAAVLTMVVTASLGRWQLSRAAQKEALQHAMDQRMAQPPLSAEQFVQQLRALQQVDDSKQSMVVDPGRDPLMHRQVALTGRWLTDKTVYLDNRQMQGKQGFFVMTPLRLNRDSNLASDAVVMVQRGWVPRNFQERTRLPDLSTPAGEVLVQGRVAAAVARLHEFVPAGKGEGASRIRQNLDLAAYGAETGLPLLPLVVLQTGAASGGLQRDWAPIDNGVDKHYGYAFQWFGLCGLVFILYVWFQFVRRLHPRSPRTA